MRTPQAVIDAARERASCYSQVGYIHLGQHNGYEVYTLKVYDENPLPVGLPEVYLFKEGQNVVTVCGMESFEMMDAADKSTRKIRL